LFEGFNTTVVDLVQQKATSNSMKKPNSTIDPLSIPTKVCEKEYKDGRDV